MKGQGFPGIKKDYSTLDTRPVRGINYYRLIQVDKDGRRTVYEIKTVQVSTIKSIVRILPNPIINTRFYIQSNEFNASSATVQVQDLAGKIIYKGTVVNAQGIYQVELQRKPTAGVYVVTLNGVSPIKLVIN